MTQAIPEAIDKARADGWIVDEVWIGTRPMKTVRGEAAAMDRHFYIPDTALNINGVPLCETDYPEGCELRVHSFIPVQWRVEVEAVPAK
jgi:hypothetical protein